MFFTIEKFQRRVQELGNRRYMPVSDITPFLSMEGTQDQDRQNVTFPNEMQGELFDIHDYFIGRDKYLWLDKELILPEEKAGYELIGLFDFGETEAGNNSGFESMLYVDGQPYQGVDSNHKEVFFTGKEGEHVRLTFLLWTGLEGGGQQTVTLKSDYNLKEIIPCNLLEHDLGEGMQGAEHTFKIKPFELKTFKLYFEK